MSQEDANWTDPVTPEDIMRELGEVDDTTIRLIVETGATFAEVACAGELLRGRDVELHGERPEVIDQVVSIVQDDWREREDTEEVAAQWGRPGEDETVILPVDEEGEVVHPEGTLEGAAPRVGAPPSLLRASSPWAAVPLRLALGCSLLYQGLVTLFGGTSFQSLEQALQPSLLAGWMLSGFEVFAGLALLLGVLVRPIAVLGILARLVVLAVGGNHGYEVSLFYFAGFLALLATGAGPLSIDHWRRQRAARRYDEPHVGMHTGADNDAPSLQVDRDTYV